MSSTDEMPEEMVGHIVGDSAANERYVRANLGAKVRQTLGKLSFVREAVAAYFCARDANTPLRVKAAILAALAYFIMPLDVVPDLIAVLGYTDDATVFWAAYRLIAPHISAAHREHAAAYLLAEKPGGENTAD